MHRLTGVSETIVRVLFETKDSAQKNMRVLKSMGRDRLDEAKGNGYDDDQEIRRRSGWGCIGYRWAVGSAGRSR